MAAPTVTDLRQVEETRHRQRLDFLDSVEMLQSQAPAWGYQLLLLPDNSVVPIKIDASNSGGQGIPKKGDHRPEDDKVEFKSVAEAIDYGLDLVGPEFTTADVLNHIRQVAPAFYNNRDLSSFSHQLKKQTLNGRIQMTVRGAGNKSSRYIKVSPVSNIFGEEIKE